jgi:anti-sigma factor RsiW
MKPLDASSRDEWMDARVEAYVDGDLSDEDRETFEEILEEEAHWQTQVQQAQRIQEGLRSLPQPSTPPEVTQSILDRTSRSHQPLPWWKDTLQQVIHTWRALVAARRRPAVDYAVGLAFIAVAVVFVVWPLTEPDAPRTQSSSQLQIPVTAPYSQTDVDRARTKAEWTLDYVSRISDAPTETTTARPDPADPVPDVIPNDSSTTVRFPPAP